MFTQCPGCHTLFRISRRELAQADGRVRCGLCQEAFNASHLLRDRLPPELDQILGLEMGEHVRRTVLSQAIEGGPEPPPPPRLSGSPAQLPAVAGPAARAAPDHPPGPALPEALPLEFGPVSAPESSGGGVADFREQAVLHAEGRLTSHAGQRFPVGRLALALLLAALLGAQWLYFQRDSLARDPVWRPVVAGLCQLAGCRLPLVRHPEQLALLSRTLRSHPERPGAMLLTATVVNRGDPQPWPQLGVTLRRMNGAVAARRWFSADEYLDLRVPGRATAGPMPSGEAYSVRLAFLDPGQGADNFELDFR